MDRPKERASVLIVDDERANIAALDFILKSEYTVYVAANGFDAVESAKENLPDVILLDILMPDMDGYEVLLELKSIEKTREIPIIFVTGLIAGEDEERGLALGAADYITKPFRSAIVKLRVKNQIEHLEQLGMIARLRNAILDTLAELVERRDNITGRHIARTQNYLRLLVKLLIEHKIYIDELLLWDVELFILSSQLHDVGKISIKDDILMKPGELTPEERKIMEQHVNFGCDIIEEIKRKADGSAFLHHATLTTSCHHEKWDGTGYPKGLSGLDIPLQGRLMAIADVYDALTNDRPYRNSLTHKVAIEHIKSQVGTHFDPAVGEIFIKYEKEFENLAKSLKL